MAIYLKKFETQAAYEAAQSSLILPNVSLTVDNNTVHYNPSTPPTPTETRLVAKSEIGEYDISEPIQIMGEEATSYFSSIEIDGVELPSVVTAYTFSTAGEHTVKYTLADPTTIGSYVFYGCNSLTSITIPDSVTTIGGDAFSSCGFITCIIGNAITSIGDYAFYNSSYLESVTINAITPPTLGSDIFGGEMSTPTIYVPIGSVNAYKTANDWSYYAEYIEPIQ